MCLVSLSRDGEQCLWGCFQIFGQLNPYLPPHIQPLCVIILDKKMRGNGDTNIFEWAQWMQFFFLNSTVWNSWLPMICPWPVNVSVTLIGENQFPGRRVKKNLASTWRVGYIKWRSFWGAELAFKPLLGVKWECTCCHYLPCWFRPESIKSQRHVLPVAKSPQGAPH